MKTRAIEIKLIILMVLLLAFIARYLQLLEFNGYYFESDTDNYLRYYGDEEFILHFRADYLYFVLSHFFSIFSSFEFFLSFVFVIFYLSIVVFFVDSFGYSWRSLIFLFVCLFYPSYNSLSELVIRQGIGFAILFFFGFYIYRATLWRKLIVLFFASLFHVSFVFYGLVIILQKFFIKQLSHAIKLWLLFAFVYVFDFPLKLVGIFGDLKFSDDALSGYVLAEYIVGFKLNFMILSAFPVLLLSSRRYRVWLANSSCGNYIYVFYLISSSIGFVFSGFGYYDRIMLFSWVLIPYLVYYYYLWLGVLMRSNGLQR